MNARPHTPTPTDADLPWNLRLKAATRTTHDALDRRIMAGDIFASRERFARFVRVQYRFHRDVDVLYSRADLAALVPRLSGRRRLAQVADDLADLGSPVPAGEPARLDPGAPLPEALGWLYVAEGSRLGGTVLYKRAAALGLDRNCGARHLDASPGGAAHDWRDFTAALNAVPLSPAQAQAMIAGAEAAFAAVRAYVAEEFA